MDLMVMFVPFITAAYLFLANDPLTEKWADDLAEAWRHGRRV